MDAASVGAIAQNVVLALIILVVGWWFANTAAKFVARAVRKAPQIDDTLAGFFGSIVRYGVLAFVVIAVLNRFGVETTSLIALIGAAGLAIGLALQGTLSNVAAGVMLMLFRPFRLGDVVTAAGQTGAVSKIDLFTTEMTTVDNVQIILPNGKVWGDVITNVTGHPQRRVDIDFTVGAGEDSDLAIAEALKVMTAHPKVLKEPAEPFARVTGLTDGGVILTTRAWCQTGDYFDVLFDLTDGIRKAIAKAGVKPAIPTSIEIAG
jgi:small conductance mechanosensitive channel